MDIGTIIYIIIIIIWVLAGSKNKNKRKPQQAPSPGEEVVIQERRIEDILSEYLEPAPAPEAAKNEEQTGRSAKEEHAAAKKEEKEKRPSLLEERKAIKQAFDKELLDKWTNKKPSTKSDVIIEATIKEVIEEPEEEPLIGKEFNFNPTDAIIYEEIMRRKYGNF